MDLSNFHRRQTVDWWHRTEKILSTEPSICLQNALEFKGIFGSNKRQVASWSDRLSRWWQLKYFFIFIPKIGEDVLIWKIFFSDGLKPPTRILMASQNGRCQVKFAQRRTSGPRQEDAIWEAVCRVWFLFKGPKFQKEGRNHELYTNLVTWWYS